MSVLSLLQPPPPRSRLMATLRPTAAYSRQITIYQLQRTITDTYKYKLTSYHPEFHSQVSHSSPCDSQRTSWHLCQPPLHLVHPEQEAGLARHPRIGLRPSRRRPMTHLLICNRSWRQKVNRDGPQSMRVRSCWPPQ